MDFAHLHVHSYFSLLDGAASPDELVQAAWDASMSAVALTDHNSLAGAVRFYQAAIEVGVKPIIGVEFDVGTAGNSGAHLVLLAEDNEGYANLCRLVTAARLGEARRESAFSDKYAEVDRDRPLLSQEHLREHCSHLIALSGCQQRGEIPALLRRKRFREAHEVAGYYRDLFGPTASSSSCTTTCCLDLRIGCGACWRMWRGGWTCRSSRRTTSTASANPRTGSRM